MDFGILVLTSYLVTSVRDDNDMFCFPSTLVEPTSVNHTTLTVVHSNDKAVWRGLPTMESSNLTDTRSAVLFLSFTPPFIQLKPKAPRRVWFADPCSLWHRFLWQFANKARGFVYPVKYSQNFSFFVLAKSATKAYYSLLDTKRAFLKYCIATFSG